MTTNTYLIKEGYENLKKHGSKTFSTRSEEHTSELQSP